LRRMKSQTTDSLTCDISPKGESEARESTGLPAGAVLTPLLGKLGARNILGNWAAQIVTFEGAFSRVPWTLQNRTIRGAAISFRGASKAIQAPELQTYWRKTKYYFTQNGRSRSRVLDSVEL